MDHVARGRGLAGVIAAVVVMVVARAGWGQCGGRWIETRGVAGLDGSARAFLSLDDHRVLVGGVFAVAGSTPAKSLAIYDRDTGTFSAVLSFDFGGTFTAVNCMYGLDDGQVLLGTRVDRGYNELPIGLVRWDPASDISTPVTLTQGGVVWAGTTRSILPLGDGRLLLTGLYYIPYGDYEAPAGIYEPSTGQWTPLSLDRWLSVYGESVGAVLADGDIVVGVPDTSYADVLHGGVLKWDPSAQRWVPLDGGVGVGPDSDFVLVSSLLELPGGDLLAGGNFTLAGALPVQGLARYSPTTGHWIEVPHLWQRGFVSSMVNIPNGEVLLGGSFELDDGTTASTLRANLETGQVERVGSLRPSGSYYSPQLGAVSDGTIFAGFNGLGGFALPAQGVAMLQPGADSWMPLTGGDAGVASTLSPLADGRVVVSGGFSRIGGVDTRNLAIYEPTTGRFTGVPSALDADVGRLRSLPDGKLVGFYGGRTDNSEPVGLDVVVIDPQNLDVSLIAGPAGYGVVARALPLPDGEIFAELGKTSGDGPQYRLARYQPQDGSWSMLSVGVPSFIEVNPYIDGGVVLYGTTLNSDGVFEAAVKLLDPLAGVVTPILVNTEDWVLSARVLPDGDIVAGGYFYSLGLEQDNHWIRLHPSSGTLDVLTLPEGVFGWQMSDLEGEAANGDLFFAASNAGGDPGNSITVYRYDWRRDVWSSVGGGEARVGNGAVFSAAELPGGDVALVGPFSRAGGEVAAGFARWTTLCHDPCNPDINGDGVLDQGDMDALVDIIAGGEAVPGVNPDFNHDGAADQGDVDALVNVIAGGECP